MPAVNPLNLENWDAYLMGLEGATIFHTSGWARVLAETYRYAPKYFVTYSNNRPAAILPLMEVNSCFTGRRAVALPFTDFIPPIFKEKQSFDQLMAEAIAHGSKVGWRKIEIRGTIPESLAVEVSEEYFTHDLVLTDNEEEMRSKMRDSAMRQVRKAARQGVVIHEQPTLEGVRQYFRLNCLTRKRHGLPPQPFSFFVSIYRNIISNGMGTVYLAYYSGRCVGGSIFFRFKDQALFKFGASESRYHGLGANNLMMWEAIKGCGRAGMRNLNFGRTEPQNDGLRRFKSGWGTSEKKIHYYTYNLSEGNFVRDNQKIMEWQKTVMRKMPIPILSFLGSMIYRHVG